MGAFFLNRYALKKQNITLLNAVLLFKIMTQNRAQYRLVQVEQFADVGHHVRKKLIYFPQTIINIPIRPQFLLQMLIMQLTARKDSFSLRIKSLDEQALKTSLMLELHYEICSTCLRSECMLINMLIIRTNTTYRFSKIVFSYALKHVSAVQISHLQADVG